MTINNMTTTEAKEWIAGSPATRKLLEELGLPDNPQAGSLDELEMITITDGMREAYRDGYTAGWNGKTE